jgi:hypothetical protein
MTLYLMRDAGVLPDFFALAGRLRSEGRFFADRHAHLSGPFAVAGRWAAPHVKVSAGAVPFRPSAGIYVVVGPQVDGTVMTEQRGVAGVWQFLDASTKRHITIAFVDGDLPGTATRLGQWCLRSHSALEWAGPLEGIDATRWGWFARLTPQ